MYAKKWVTSHQKAYTGKIDKKRVPYAKKYTGFKKSTPPRVVTAVTNISYGAGR